MNNQIIATFMLAITAQAIKYPIEKIMGLQTFVGVAAQMTAASLGGILIYLLTCWLLKSEELNLFITALRKKVGQRPVIAEEIIEKEKLT